MGALVLAGFCFAALVMREVLSDLREQDGIDIGRFVAREMRALLPTETRNIVKAWCVSRNNTLQDENKWKLNMRAV